MNTRTLSIVVFIVLCLVCAAHAFYYYSILPEQVPHHFGFTGEPDSWGSKNGFMIIYALTIGVMVLLFLGMGFFLPKFPDSTINLPNKDYWLAPERRQETLDYLFIMSLWIGSITIALLLYIFHQSVQVSLGKIDKLNYVWIATGIYLILILLWCIAIFKKFKIKES